MRGVPLLAAIMGVMLLSIHPAHADDILSQATSTVVWVYQAAHNIAYAVAGLGIMILAVGAFFGRFQFKTFFSICVGVFMVASIDSFLQLLGAPTGSGGSDSMSSILGTLQTAMLLHHGLSMIC